MTWAWIFGVLAALYNPVFRVHLDRNPWAGVNWFTVGAIAVATGVFLRNKSNLRLEVAEVNEIFRLVGFAFRHLRNHLDLCQVLFFRRKSIAFPSAGRELN